MQENQRADGVASLYWLTNPSVWLEQGIDKDRIQAWRECGFTPIRAGEWNSVLEPRISDADEIISTAFTFLAAELPPPRAADWLDALYGIVEPNQTAALAQQWLALGLEPEDAAEWGLQAPLEIVFAYHSAGWTAAESLLHLEWLRTRGITDHDPMWLLLSPASAIAYARAGTSRHDIPSLEGRRRRGENLEAILGWPLAHEQALDPWTRTRLTQLSEAAAETIDGFALKPIAGPEIAGRWTLTAWPPDVEPPPPITWSVARGDLWDGETVPDPHLGCPEDYAEEPRLEWTDAQRGALQRWLGVRDAWRDEDPDQIDCTVDWPPQAYLTSPGHARISENPPCELHVVIRRDCEDCRCANLAAPHVEPATWNFSVRADYESNEDGSIQHRETRRESILEMTVDPRTVRYSLFPLR